MASKVDVNIFARVIGLGAFPIFLLITPWNAIDPINSPKLMALVVTASICLSLLTAYRKSINQEGLRPYKIILILFLCQLVLVFFFSGANLGLQFFGTYGRNTGLLTYVSLSILSYISAILATSGSAKYLIKYLNYVLIASAVYGFLQALGLDPVPWDNILSPVIGFLGNPDFESALLGIFATFIFVQVLNPLIINRKRVLFFFLLNFLIYIIYETRAKQGLLNFLAGCVVVVFVWRHSIKKKLQLYVYSFLVASLTSMIALGIASLGPLASVLHTSSISVRQFYWDAAIQMTRHHPFFGVGLDDYGEWYRYFRTQEAATAFGPNTVSDVAHNVVLDFSSMGGLPLALIYLGLNCFILLAAFRILKRSTEFDPVFTTVFSGWVAYQAQSFVSINQIVLATIGWILGGLIVGLEIRSRNQTSTVTDKKLKDFRISEHDPKKPIAIFLGLLVGLVLSAMPYISSIKYRSAVVTNQASAIQSAAYLPPLEYFRMFQVATVLSQNKLDSEALTVARDGIKKFPRSFDLWTIIYTSPNASNSEKAEALERIKALDPFNPNFK